MIKLPLWLRALGAMLVIFLLGPSLMIIPMSLSSGRTLRFPPPGYSWQWYETLLTSSLWLNAAQTSLRVGLLTALVATILGTLTALGLARGRFWGRNALQALVLSPMIIPLVLIAIATFAVFVRWRIAGSLWGLVLAHSVLALPFVVINVLASLRTVDRNLELAAANLGAGPLRCFAYVTLPLIMPGMLAGALFAFITSWDEIVVAIFLTSPRLRTLPIVMWGQLRTELDPTIAAAATLLTLLTTAIFALGLWLRQRQAA